MLGSFEKLSWSLLWCQRKMVASMESKQTYYILHISYINSEISIGLSYIRPFFVWWFQLHHCVTLVRHFADFHFGVYRDKFVDIHYGDIVVLRISSKADFRSFSTHHPRCLANSSCMKKLSNNIKIISSTFKKRDLKVLNIKLLLYRPFR